MVSVTLEPSSPLSLLYKVSLEIFLPKSLKLLAYKIRSPGRIPAFAAGPFSIGLITATDIDSSLGQTVWNWQGTNTRTVNWNLLTSPATVASGFVN